MNNYEMVSWIWQPLCGMNSGDWAAWVQAFASVGAIWWAWLQGKKQSADQFNMSINLLALKDRTATIARFKGIRLLVESVLDSSEQLKNMLIKQSKDVTELNENMAVLLSDMKMEAEALSNIPLLELPENALEHTFVLLRLGRQRSRHVAIFDKEGLFDLTDTSGVIEELEGNIRVQHDLISKIDLVIERLRTGIL